MYTVHQDGGLFSILLYGAAWCGGTHIPTQSFVEPIICSVLSLRDIQPYCVNYDISCLRRFVVHAVIYSAVLPHPCGYLVPQELLTCLQLFL